MVTTITPLKQKSQIIQMNENNSSQRGARLTVKQKITDNLSGSVAYVYGESTSISELKELVSSEYLNSNLADFMRQSYQHSITGSLNATIPLTKTTLVGCPALVYPESADPGRTGFPTGWISEPNPPTSRFAKPFHCRILSEPKGNGMFGWT